ncbi:MAG: hypothetical protein ACLP50_13575 [Solirubrobacteraceae bacterium]
MTVWRTVSVFTVSGRITHLAEPQPGAPAPSIVIGGLGFVADLDTLSFVKHRQAGERHVFYVTFAAEHPRLGLLEMKYADPVEPALPVPDPIARAGSSSRYRRV